MERTGMVPVTHGTLIVAEARGLKKAPSEQGERKICLERLPEDDPSGIRFQVCVDHPEFVSTPTGRSRQYPEIVYRSNDEAAAKNAYAVYCRALGGTPPASFDAPATSAAAVDTSRFVSREDFDALSAQIDALTDAVEQLTKHKK